MEHDSLSRAGLRTTKTMIYMLVLIAIHTDTEWAHSYERLVPRKCTYDDRLKKYKGKRKVIGRIAGQMISLIYALLKTDQEVISKFPPGATLPDPTLYDRAHIRAIAKESILQQSRKHNRTELCCHRKFNFLLTCLDEH